MSLAVLANHMASKGRHGDDMLVHMSKDEVAALQKMAEQHGMTLTINPETGLPEAFSLKQLLGVVAPIALNFMFPGLGSTIGGALLPGASVAAQTALGGALVSGGISALATGSLEKGLMTGLMSYGLSGLGEAAKTAGEAAKQVPVSQAAEAAAIASPTDIAAATQAPVTPPPQYTPTPAAQAELAGTAPVSAPPTVSPQDAFARSETLGRNAASQAYSDLSPFGKMQAAFQGDPNFLKNNWKNLAMVGLPALSLMSSQPSLKGVGEQDPSLIRFPRFRVDATGRAYQEPGFTLADYRKAVMEGRNPVTYAADGGIVALADGGAAMTPSYQRTSMSPGMLDFADRSEPVVRMRDGGVARFAGEDKSLVSDPGAPLTGQAYADAMANVNNLLAQAATEQQARNAAATNTFDSGISAADRAEAAMFGGATTTPAGGGISSLVNTGATSATGMPAPQQIGNTGYSLTTGGNILDASGAPVTTLSSLSANAWDPANAALLQAISGSGLTAGPGQLTDLSIGNVGANLPVATAYNEAQRTGDYTNLNNLLAQRGMSIEDAARTFNLGQKDVDYLKGLTGAKFAKEESEQNRADVTNLYRNVLGRDPDEAGLNYWGSQLAAGKSKEQVAKDFVASANTVLGGMGLPGVTVPTDLTKAFGTYTTPTGYTLTNSATLNRTIGDEWVQNVLGGRAMTDADRKSEWFKATSNAYTAEQMQRAFDAFLKENKIDKSKAPDWYDASKFALSKVVQKPPVVQPPVLLPPNTTTTTPPIAPVIPGAGPVPTMSDVVREYTQGGGSTGYIPYYPKSIAELEARYPLSGASADAYNYLMGKPGAKYPVAQKVPGGIMKSYWDTVGQPAPEYKPKMLAPAASDTTSTVGPPTGSYQGLMASDKTALQNALRDAQSSKDYAPLNALLKAYKLTKADLLAAFPGLSEKDIAAYADKLSFYEPPVEQIVTKDGGLLSLARGGLGELRDSDVESAYDKAVKRQDVPRANKLKGEIDYRQRMRSFSINEAPSGLEQFKNPVAQYNAMARGGMSPSMLAAAAAKGGISHLGDYSDGGRLLKGPGDGVSDSIPATIANKRPARLADGEFVVPARIVSELGNGSTDAGARKLYAMMDRIQANRRKTVGKGKVAVNSRADKYLPA